MKMYVANPTPQRVEFYYRVPEHQKLRQQTIAPHGQIEISGNMSKEQIDYIVDQHEKFGMVSVDDVTASRKMTRFGALIYSVDRPISSARIEAMLRSNIAILNTQGQEFRKKAAIATSNELIRAIQQSSDNDLASTDISRVKVSIQQDFKDGDDMTTRDGVSEGFEVQQADTMDRPAGRKRR